MTSDGGRLTPVDAGSLTKPVPPDVATITRTLGGQPCPSLAHSSSAWMSTRTPLPWRMSPKIMAPR